MLLGVTGCDYFEKSAYTIEREDSYRNISKNLNSVNFYNNSFKELDSCLKEVHVLNKEALEEYRIKMEQHLRAPLTHSATELILGHTSSIPSTPSIKAPETPRKYGCILYKESDFGKYRYGKEEEKYEKLFSN
jgi:hypothetical protein